MSPAPYPDTRSMARSILNLVCMAQGMAQLQGAREQALASGADRRQAHMSWTAGSYSRAPSASISYIEYDWVLLCCTWVRVLNLPRIRMIDRIARAVDRSTARERNEKQDQDKIQDNQTLLCLSPLQKTHQAAPRHSWRSRTASWIRIHSGQPGLVRRPGR